MASTLNWETKQVNLDLAAAHFARAVGGAAAKQVHESHKEFCRRHYNNFFDSGNVEDRPRSGRPREIAAEDAKAAGELLMSGFWKEVKVLGGGGATEERLILYPTFADAVKLCPQLKELMEKYKCSDRLMLATIHRHCPDLKRITLFSHHEFTVAEKQKRIEYGSYMLGMLKKEPSFLHLIVFCDESSFVLHGRTKHEVKVYCSTNAVLPSEVCHVSDLTIKPITVHFFLAVTANACFSPSGVVLYDVCTGTTDIKRLVNKHWDGSTRVSNWEYQVSA